MDDWQALALELHGETEEVRSMLEDYCLDTIIINQRRSDQYRISVTCNLYEVLKRSHVPSALETYLKN